MKQILVPVDGSAASQKAAEKAVSLAKLLNAELTFLTVVNLPTEDKYSYFGMTVENAFIANRKNMLKQLIHEETRMLSILVRNLDCGDLKVKQTVVVGVPAEQIIKVAGSVTQKVIAASPCPIMIINV